MFAVSAEPIVAFVDAFKGVLSADATLSALVTGVYGHLSEAARVSYPYLVLGHRSADGNAGAMGIAGDVVTLQLDGWSDAKGPYQMEAIGSRVYVLMERRRGFRVPGFVPLDGSLHREMGEYFDEPDDSKPGSKLYRMVQRWTVEIHEAA